MNEEKHIWLLELHYRVSKTLQRILKLEGYRVSEVPLKKALEQFQKDLPDLILMYIGASTAECQDFLSELKRFSSTPVIGLVDYIETQKLISDADDFIIMPFEIGILLEKIRKLVD